MDNLYLLRLLGGEKLLQLLIEYLDPDTGIQNNYLVFFLSGQIDSQHLERPLWVESRQSANGQKRTLNNCHLYYFM